MKRVRPNRCGYEGYTCVGLSVSDSVFGTSKMIRDTSYSALPADADENLRQGWSAIDNYLNLPVKIKGSVTTADMLLDMQKDKIGTTGDLFKPPEITCKQDYSPFTVEGFLDLYNKLYSSMISVCMKDLSQAYSSMYESLLTCTTRDGKGDGALEERIGEEYELWPGIVEPMVDTSFSPIDIEAVPALQAAIDSLTYTEWEFAQWRLEIEKLLNELALRSPVKSSSSISKHFKAFRTLFKKRYSKIDECKYFKITLNRGSTLVWTGNDFNSVPTYNISYGYARINGVDLLVNGLVDVPAPFWAYVNIKFEDPDEITGQYKTVTASLVTDTNAIGPNDYAIGIGGVIEVESDKKLSPRYKMYEIVQERCEIDEDIVRTASEGILEKLDDSISPWGIRKTTKCNKLKAADAQENSDSQQP